MREIHDASAREMTQTTQQGSPNENEHQAHDPTMRYDHSPHKREPIGISTTTDTTVTHVPDDTSDVQCFNLSFESGDIGYDSDKDCNLGEDSSGDEECIEAEDATMNLRSQLAQWKLRYGVTDAAMNGLLAILKPFHPRLPKDSRTIVPPPKNVLMKAISGGTYHHFGFLSALRSALRDCDVSHSPTLEVQLGIDGLPVYKSNNMHLWPILGRVENVQPQFRRVFVIGIFYGDSKPEWCHEFLQDFCDEYATLRGQLVTVNGARVRLQVTSIICDAQARAFIKCTRSFNHSKGCDKCEEEASWDGRTVFLGQKAARRTDDSFRRRRDQDHHTIKEVARGQPEVSPLEAVGVGTCASCPLSFSVFLFCPSISLFSCVVRDGRFTTGHLSTITKFQAW